MKINNVIFDRDGVINQDSEHYVKTADEFILIDDAVNSLIKLHNNKINIFVATNQSGINRGYYSLDDFFAINKKLITQFDKQVITSIYYCPHTPDQNCSCRKPKPGMINKIVANHNINLEHTAFIGDSMRDITAAKSAGCKLVLLVKTGNGQHTFSKNKNSLPADLVVLDNLTACVDYILNL